MLVITHIHMLVITRTSRCKDGCSPSLMHQLRVVLQHSANALKNTSVVRMKRCGKQNNEIIIITTTTTTTTTTTIITTTMPCAINQQLLTLACVALSTSATCAASHANSSATVTRARSVRTWELSLLL